MATWSYQNESLVEYRDSDCVVFERRFLEVSTMSVFSVKVLPGTPIRVKGWPRGWRQFKTRTRLIIQGPSRKNRRAEWQYVTKFYKEIKDGASFEWFVKHINDDFKSSIRSLYHVYGLLGLPIGGQSCTCDDNASSVVKKLMNEVALGAVNTEATIVTSTRRTTPT